MSRMLRGGRLMVIVATPSVFSNRIFLNCKEDHVLKKQRVCFKPFSSV